MPIPIYPTYSGIAGAEKFPSLKIVHDTTRRIRFVNVRTIGKAASPRDDMRILCGIMNVGKKWTEWQWKATGYPMKDFYVWEAIVLDPPEEMPQSGAFTKDRLDRIALQADTHGFTFIEEITHFMVGCLTAFGACYQAAIAEDMEFSPPKEIE